MIVPEAPAPPWDAAESWPGSSRGAGATSTAAHLLLLGDKILWKTFALLVPLFPAFPRCFLAAGPSLLPSGPGQGWGHCRPPEPLGMGWMGTRHPLMEPTSPPCPQAGTGTWPDDFSSATICPRSQRHGFGAGAGSRGAVARSRARIGVWGQGHAPGTWEGPGPRGGGEWMGRVRRHPKVTRPKTPSGAWGLFGKLEPVVLGDLHIPLVPQAPRLDAKAFQSPRVLPAMTHPKGLLFSPPNPTDPVASCLPPPPPSQPRGLWGHLECHHCRTWGQGRGHIALPGSSLLGSDV